MRMKPFAGIRRALRLGAWRRELDDELVYHFDRTVEDLVARGMSRKGAINEAHRRFGNEDAYRRELERIDQAADLRRRLADRFELVAGSAKYALRRMRRAPGFTSAVVLTFALGIGANATMFGILDRLLLSPPTHVEDPSSLRRLMVNRFNIFTGTRTTIEALTFPDYEEFTRASSFSSVAAVSSQEIVVGRGPEASQQNADLVTGNFFSLLGVRPEVGRFFGPDEDSADAPGVAVISYGLWQRRYGGDPEIVGMGLEFGYGEYTIVGVAPSGFVGTQLRRVDLWLPIQVATPQLMGRSCLEGRGCYWVRATGRLADGISPTAAETEATVLYRQGRAEDPTVSPSPDPEAEVIAAPVIEARGPLASSESKVAIWLAAISLIVLLIACANIANLLLARATRQQRELGLRLALGSSRGRLLAQVATESLLLALLGGATAILVTRVAGGVIRQTLLPDVPWDAPGADLRIIVIALLLAIIAGLAAGLFPALRSSGFELVTTLKAASRNSSSADSHVRSFLTVIQAALCVVLLIGAGLFVRSLNRVDSLDLGLDPEDVLFARPVFEPGVPTTERAAFYREATDRLQSIPGVSAVSADMSVPFYITMARPLRAPDLDSIPTQPGGSPISHLVGASYFDVLDLDILRGRGFNAEDGESAPPVVVINQTMARVLWLGEEALGKCLILDGDPDGAEAQPCAEVVGIVENARRFSLVEDESMHYYVPLEQQTTNDSPRGLLVRVTSDVGPMIPSLRREIVALDPRVRFAEVQPLGSLLDPEIRSWKLGAAMFSVFGLLALLVAGIGLYSVLAFSVAQRTFELGIRSALGASRERIVALILGQGMRLGLIGLGLGVVIALLAAPRIEPLLFQVSPHDPATILAVVGILSLVAVLASILPAWRAARADPAVALRAD
ncbi:MAG: FtsX-like permease family protein [Gemmatimonas sp.]|nr:FtsX-like permease family protein [Gemmatimonas sp.]